MLITCNEMDCANCGYRRQSERVYFISVVMVRLGISITWYGRKISNSEYRIHNVAGYNICI